MASLGVLERRWWWRHKVQLMRGHVMWGHQGVVVVVVGLPHHRAAPVRILRMGQSSRSSRRQAPVAALANMGTITFIATRHGQRSLRETEDENLSVNKSAHKQ